MEEGLPVGQLEAEPLPGDSVGRPAPVSPRAETAHTEVCTTVTGEMPEKRLVSVGASPALLSATSLWRGL